MNKLLGIPSGITLICMTCVVVWTVSVLSSDDNSSKVVEILELSEKCLDVQSVDNRQSINPLCMSELDLMFYQEPIWKFYSVPSYEQFNGGWFYVPVRSLKRGGKSLGFTVEDYFGTDFPTFNLIFDNRYHSRQHKINRSLSDLQCTDLSNNWGTDQTFIQHCDARNLTIYAITLDVCATAFERYQDSHSNYFPTTSDFQSGIKRLEEGWGQGDNNRSWEHPDDDGYSFVRGNLLTIWTLHKCSESTYAFLGFEQDYFNLSRGRSRDSEELKKLTGMNLQLSATDLEEIVNPLYDLAITTAAQLGDPWAIRMVSPPKPSEDSRFWAVLLARNPSLYHRYLSSDQVKTNLPLNEKIVHAFTAFELFKSRFEEPILVEHRGKIVQPNKYFADYLKMDRDFTSITRRYSDVRLNSLQAIEEVRTVQPDRGKLRFNNRTPRGPINTITITVEEGTIIKVEKHKD